MLYKLLRCGLLWEALLLLLLWLSLRLLGLMAHHKDHVVIPNVIVCQAVLKISEKINLIGGEHTSCYSVIELHCAEEFVQLIEFPTACICK